MKKVSDLIVEELRHDSALRVMHLQDAMYGLFQGNRKVSLIMFRNIINATTGFVKASKITKIPEKSLMRMLSKDGNPNTDNLIKIVSFLMKQENIHDLELKKAC